MRNNYISKVFNVLTVLFGLIVLVSCFNLLLFTDEAFTMGIIKYNFFDLVKVASMDVHPPLYYIIIKLYLMITTFWTSNLFIKIISARLFSLVCSLITFYFLQKILSMITVKKINTMVSLSLFFLLTAIPYKFSPMYNLMEIRMYGLCGLFVVMQIYFMIKFSNNGMKRFAVSYVILAVLSAYSHYISGLISGLLILGFLLFEKEYKKTYWYTGLVMIVSYVPWIPVALSQFAQISGDKWWISNSFFEENVLLTLICIFVFVVPLIKHLKTFTNGRTVIKSILLVIFVLLLISVLTSIIGSPMFQGRYMYPIFIIFAYVSTMISLNDVDKYKYYLVVIFLFMLGGNYMSLKNQIVNYDINSIKTVKYLSNVKNDSVEVKVNKDVQSPITQTELIYYKYNNIFVSNYKEYINHFKNSNIKFNRKNYFLNKYVYFMNEKDEFK